MTETPRTDAECNRFSRVAVNPDCIGELMISAKFAKSLETQLESARKIAWDWAQGVTDAETAIRELYNLFPLEERR